MHVQAHKVCVSEVGFMVVMVVCLWLWMCEKCDRFLWVEWWDSDQVEGWMVGKGGYWKSHAVQQLTCRVTEREIIMQTNADILTYHCHNSTPSPPRLLRHLPSPSSHTESQYCSHAHPLSVGHHSHNTPYHYNIIIIQHKVVRGMYIIFTPLAIIAHTLLV